MSQRYINIQCCPLILCEGLALKISAVWFSSAVTYNIMLLCGMNYLTELCVSLYCNSF